MLDYKTSMNGENGLNDGNNIITPVGGSSVAVILLVEDERSKDPVVSETLAKLGYQCHSIPDVEKALELTEYTPEPDVLIISSDTRFSAELERLYEQFDCYLPVIVIGENIDDDLLMEYEKAGVDRFISQPVNPRWLRLCVQSALRLRQLYRHEINQRKQLLTYRQQVDQEQEVAAKIYNNVLQGNYLQTEAVKSVMSSMALFNGDLLLVDRTPDNHLYLLLGDFTGHGLSASVAATPVADIFYGMARKGFAIVDIVQEINAKLYKMLPTNRFLAATAAALNPDSKTLSLFTCGLPEHFLVSDLDGSYKVIGSKNIPLGIQRTIALEKQDFGVNQHHHLYLMTDGVFEAQNREGEGFGAERIVAAVCNNPATGMDTLKANLASHTHGLGQQDDMSFVELICDVDNVPWQSGSAEQATRRIQALRWKTAMEFDADALRLLNPVPVMVNALMEIQGLHEHRQSIFLIISELFTNALDHGVLGLDSMIKDTPEGFLRFYELKDEGIQGLQQGKIRLLFSHEPTDEGGRLTIKVSDSGNGFDWRRRKQDLQENISFSGRGLKLVETLCSRITFHGKGNRVTAVFDWRN